MDRRRLITGLTAAGALFTLLGGIFSAQYLVVLVLGFIVGGVANPLYSLIIAYTNDFLDKSDMAAASAGLLFINGLGAMTGPLIIGAAMTRFGPDAFFAYIGTLFALIALYALYRATRAPRRAVAETSSYAPVTPQASPVALEVAQEVAIERAGGALTAASLFHPASVRLPAHEEDEMDPTARELLDFWLGLGPEAWYRGGEALDAGDPRPLGRALGEGPHRRARPLARRRPTPASRSSSCSTSFPATCSATTPAPSPATPRALTVAKTAILHGQDRRVDAARAAVLLHAAHAFRGSRQPGPVGAAVPA